MGDNNTAYEPPHVIEARLLEAAALRHHCHFCQADAGEPCRSRTSGREVFPHSRRVALTRPKDERRPAAQTNALCCVCGNLRTVSSDFSRYQDPNNANSSRGKTEGWRKTESLKCDACGERTRHALLHPADARFKDWDEQQQLIALGDPDTREYPMGEQNIERLRREYREMFPRNPYLRHRRWTEDAKKAWAEGHKQVTALCGEKITVKSDPNRPSTKVEEPGRLVADQLSDTEYEDPDTGLWWIDMACVDCCRVSNNLHWAAQRKRLEWFLAKFACSPELVPESAVGELLEYLEEAFEQGNGSED
ncbi:zinc finger domain-containing protein [Mycolicibacterium frederiksbergense]|uniref:zinc finger domain-containing protein n=1 Tax=Mycolicibacterium frederiksbergense TaxID=117567 RepID=UPI00265BF06D|nr:hypothetical protein [Mycolicibacterium frederiksbergense]MDO0977189.1 hypothetical protein [Mycolicibacterium frederiksbergense]